MTSTDEHKEWFSLSCRRMEFYSVSLGILRASYKRGHILFLPLVATTVVCKLAVSTNVNLYPPKKEKKLKKKERKEIRTLSSMCISLQLTTGTVLIRFFSCYRSKTTHLFHILLLVQKVKYWHKRKKWFQPLYKTANIHEGISNYTVPPSVSTKISMRSPPKKG